MNSTFLTSNILETLERHVRILEPEIPRHFRRWQLSQITWEREIRVIAEFARKRPSYMWDHLEEYFNLASPVVIRTKPSEGGRLIINDVVDVADQMVFEAQYFPGIPITVTAEADLGYRFSHWKGAKKLRGAELYVDPDRLKNEILEPVFVPIEGQLQDVIVINEVNPVGKKTGDWVELYNRSDQTISLRGWQLKDQDGNRAKLPDLRIPPRDYLVLTQKQEKFMRAYPLAYNAYPVLNFGLNKRVEQLKLFDGRGAAIDSIGYAFNELDTLFTWQLQLPWQDNGKTENWNVAFGMGAPSAANPHFLESTVIVDQEKWLEVGLAVSIILLGVFLIVYRRQDQVSI